MARKRYPGVIKISVSPSKGWITPCSSAALSRSRRLVVPTETMRPPLARVAFIFAAAAAVIKPRSACIR